MDQLKGELPKSFRGQGRKLITSSQQSSWKMLKRLEEK